MPQKRRQKNREPLEEAASFGATWESRLGPKNTFGVFYDADHEGKAISILAIGYNIGGQD